MAISTVSYQRRQERQQAPKESALDLVMKGLQVVGGVTGIYSDVKRIQGANADLAKNDERKEAIARANRNEMTESEFKDDVASQRFTPVDPHEGDKLPPSVLKKFVIQSDGTKRPVFLQQLKPLEMEAKAVENEAQRTAKEKSEKLQIENQLKLAQFRKDARTADTKLDAELRLKAKKAIDSESKLSQFKSLAPEDQRSIQTLAGTRANVQAIRDQINANMTQWDKAKTDNERLDIGRKMIKLLNSTQGADAVSAEEAKRLAGKLEFAYGNLLDSNPVQFGRDLEGFRKDVENTRDILSSSYNTINESIKGYYGVVPTETQPTLRPQLVPSGVNKTTGREIYIPGKR